MAYEIIQLEREIQELGVFDQPEWLTQMGAVIQEDYTPDEADVAEATGFVRWTLSQIESRVAAGTLTADERVAAWINRATAALAVTTAN